LTAACEADVAQIELALSHLAALDLDEATLDGFQSAQEDARRAAGRCRSTIQVLNAKQALLEEAVNATPDAAKTEFYQDGDAGPYGRGGSRPAPAQPPAGANPEEDEMPAANDARPAGGDDEQAEQQPAASRLARYYRCGGCGYVVGPQEQQPGGCPNCQTRGGVFTPTEIAFPARPSEEAIAQDTRDVEAAIREAYGSLAGHRGAIVPLADVRAALPADLDRETVDAALTKLAGHADVHVFPRTDQKQAAPTTQQAALPIGGGYSHSLIIEGGRPRMTTTLQAITMTSRVQAESMLAPLDDTEVAYLADRMGVDTTGTPADVRRRIAQQAETNRQQWHADARQGEEDGKLLARADHDPEWVQGWTDADRQAAREAGARLLARADHDLGWAYIRERATRWL